jgi:hypothetical protein
MTSLEKSAVWLRNDQLAAKYNHFPPLRRQLSVGIGLNCGKIIGSRAPENEEPVGTRRPVLEIKRPLEP